MAEELTLAKIISLGIVDSVNPCTLAILTLVLIAIITYNPKKRRDILLTGFAFTLSIYIIYFIYGLIIVKFFQIVQALTALKLILYKILGTLAIILGFLEVKDFVRYKPGGLATEMPLSWRPKVKALISGITSPRGAFGIGAFCAVFLLPCTIGPYIIAGGILSILKILESIPWLLLYDAIFVIPMIAITLAVWVGATTVERVSGWREKNIRYLHLIAGLIMLGIGIGMLLGLI